VVFQTSNILDDLCAGNYDVITKDNNNCTVASVQNINEPTAVTYTTNITPSTCGIANGEIEINANGGTPGYTYSNNNGTTFVAGNTLTDLNSDSYNVVVQANNGCELTSIEVVNSETSPVITSVFTRDVLCNGDATGQIYASAFGGTGALTYDMRGAGQ